MNDKQIAPWIAAVNEAESRFVAMTDQKTWEKESLFAMQIVMKNDYLKTIANKNPQSLRNAVANIAAIGITLNPALAYAYLVPRDNMACLDISYKGLIKIATDTGAIKWAQAELVYANDFFEYNGPTQPPIHRFDPFSKDRGEFQGAYCTAKTADGDMLSEAMSASEIYEIRDKSEMYKRAKKGPWVDFFGEMAKKTVIKRASKTWPKSTHSIRLEKAIEMLNESGEGIEFEPDSTTIKDVYTIEQKEQFQKCLDENDSLGLYLLVKSMPQSAWIDLYNSGEKGHKVKVKSRCDALLIEGKDIIDALNEAVGRDDENGVFELIDGTNDDLLTHLPSLLEDGAGYLRIAQELQNAS